MEGNQHPGPLGPRDNLGLHRLSDKEKTMKEKMTQNMTDIRAI